MLGTLKPQQKSDWKFHVAPLVHAYNSTQHDSTGFAPFFLMFGRNPRLPIDIMFGIEENESYQSYTDYMNSLKDRLQSAYDLATKEANENRAKQKSHFDLEARTTVIHPGDRVLVRINAYEGKHKIADRWEDDVYVVTKQPNTYVPVFIVKRENDSDSSSRTLHTNLLLPIGSLPLVTESEIDKISETDIVQSQNEESAECIKQDTIDQSDVNNEDSNVESEEKVFRQMPESVHQAVLQIVTSQ